ncbi:MAG: Na+:solute symporter [Sterolibacteriaceae bacterium]|nr:Na+:solute symporter [Sterolibacteriaceae bacterium]
MAMSRVQAIASGAGAIVVVLLLQAFNSFACYRMDFATFLSTTAMFVVPALIPAFVCLALPNPLRAVVACLFFAPWLVLAYVTDCVFPYSGGGASMIYVAVLLWGTPCALLGALLGTRIARRFGFQVYEP